MKKIILLISISLILLGCTEIEVQLDWQYGVKYRVESESNRGGTLTLYLDPVNTDVVAALFITPVYTNEEINSEIVELLEEENSTNFRNQKNEKTIYCYFDNGDNKWKYQEWIRINFSKEDLNLKEHPTLIEYLGLEKELEDGILYYQEELLKSETFKYKWMLEKGVFENNVSFMRDPKYDYPKEN